LVSTSGSGRDRVGLVRAARRSITTASTAGSRRGGYLVPCPLVGRRLQADLRRARPSRLQPAQLQCAGMEACWRAAPRSGSWAVEPAAGALDSRTSRFGRMPVLLDHPIADLAMESRVQKRWVGSRRRGLAWSWSEADPRPPASADLDQEGLLPDSLHLIIITRTRGSSQIKDEDGRSPLRCDWIRAERWRVDKERRPGKVLAASHGK